MDHHTLIEPESDVFTTASAMSVGQKIMFSGNFFKQDDGCIDETSLRLRSKLEKPEFVFLFSTVSMPHVILATSPPAANLANDAPTEAVPKTAPPDAINHVISTKIAAVIPTEEAALSPPAVQGSQAHTSAIRAHNEPFVIRGVEKRCNDITQLDRALSTSYGAYFDRWTRADYDEAIVWSSACAQYGWQSIASSRVSLLQARETSALTR